MTDFLSDPRLTQIAADHPYPLVFMTISGAHLYGFPSPDSDYDLRGVHILPVPVMLGLTVDKETISHSQMSENLEIDHVTHDLRKFSRMVLKRNGYVLEQLFSPLVVQTTPAHAELKSIAHDCITRNHSYHYFGFAETQWRLFNKESPHRIKPLLYTFRVLLTGIHLMHTGNVLANLPELNAIFRLPYISELIARKQTEHEQTAIASSDTDLFQREFNRLNVELQTAHEESALREAVSPATYAVLNDWVVRTRLNSG